jgi:Spy/CpxP family protein refolding chaperone
LLNSVVPELRETKADRVSIRSRLKGASLFTGNGRAIFLGIIFGAAVLSTIGISYRRYETARHNEEARRKFLAIINGQQASKGDRITIHTPAASVAITLRVSENLRQSDRFERRNSSHHRPTRDTERAASQTLNPPRRRRSIALVAFPAARFLATKRNFQSFAGFPFTRRLRSAAPDKYEKKMTMKSRLITLTAACVALSATASFGQAEDPAGKDWHSRDHHNRGNPVEHLTKALDLTPDQRAKIQPIFEQAKPQIMAIRQEAMQKIKAIRENTQAQIRPILTPDQQQKFDALKKAREDMRKARQEMREARKQ